MTLTLSPKHIWLCIFCTITLIFLIKNIGMIFRFKKIIFWTICGALFVSSGIGLIVCYTGKNYVQTQEGTWERLSKVMESCDYFEPRIAAFESYCKDHTNSEIPSTYYSYFCKLVSADNETTFNNIKRLKNAIEQAGIRVMHSR